MNNSFEFESSGGGVFVKQGPCFAQPLRLLSLSHVQRYAGLRLSFSVCGCMRVFSGLFLPIFMFPRALHGMPRYRTMRAVWRGVKCLARWSYPARCRLSMRSSQRFIQAIRCFTAAWGELSGKYISASSFFAHAHA